MHIRPALAVASALASAAAVLPASATNGPTPASSAQVRWVPSFRDDFSGSTVDSTRWATYDAHRAPANVAVGNGLLTLRTTKVNGVWQGAGVTNARSFSQTYGKFLVRVRVDRGYGIRATALLWPSGGGWPPEVDFLEMGGTDPRRTTNHLTNHYGAANSMQHAASYADFSSWHTVGVEWTPDALVYTLDGVVQARMTGHVPTVPMWLGLQTRTGQAADARPNSSTPPEVDLQVDWVQIYRMG